MPKQNIQGDEALEIERIYVKKKSAGKGLWKGTS